MDECLHSVFSQDYKDLEVIAVNDGSTDRSREILAKHQGLGRNLIILDQSNGGHSVARNSGIKAAKGKYISFVDTDDKIAPNLVSKCLELAETENLQVVTFNAMTFGKHIATDEKNSGQFRKSLEQGIYGGTELFELLLEDSAVWVCVWMFFFKRSFLESAQLEFKPGLVHDDVEFTPRMLSKVKKVGVIGEALYFYRQDRVDAITKTTTRKNSELELLATYKQLYKESRDDDFGLPQKEVMARFLLQRYFMLLSGNVGSGSQSKLSRRRALSIALQIFNKKMLRKQIPLSKRWVIVSNHIVPEVLIVQRFFSERTIGPIRRLIKFQIVPLVHKLRR